MNKKHTELLAPAKDKETAFAAIDCGADAVYIGASLFGARQNAANSLEDIKEVIEYAHKFWAKVFITVNTILTDDELESAVELVKALDKLNADAILVQDMGLLKRLAELKLSIPIHMSTQCDNREIEKISYFNKIGASRVVLARELSIDKIREIHKTNPDLELEAFVHGALCVSYSGQCYLSQYIGGRSANRGECAQPCRKKYTVKNTQGKIFAKDIYALSLKDFNASKNIKDMIEAGVYSFKIEGRLKDIGYVKNIVSYYRQELDKYSQKASSGHSICTFTPNPDKSFNRGFTNYFLEGRCDSFNQISPKSIGEYIGKVKTVDKNWFVIETNKPLSPQDGLCFIKNNTLEGFLINKIEGNKIFPNKKFELKCGVKIFRNQDVDFEKELLKPVKRQIGVNITFKNGCIFVKDEDGISTEIFIKANEKANNAEKMANNFVKQFSKTGESDFYIKDIKIASEVPFMPVSELNRLRRECFDRLMQKRLSEYKREIQKPIKTKEYYKKEVDYRANIHNKTAQKFYEEAGVNVIEGSFESKTPERQVELMRTKHCIKYALDICKSKENLILVDEKGQEYPLRFDCKNCEMAVLSPCK